LVVHTSGQSISHPLKTFSGLPLGPKRLDPSTGLPISWETNRQSSGNLLAQGTVARYALSILVFSRPTRPTLKISRIS
jgi:hypothetical protein